MSSGVALATSTGLVRKRNEDSVYVGRWLCAVADGMGGHAAGDVASATVIEAVREFDFAVEDPGKLTGILARAVRAANDSMAARARSGRGLEGMGSTLTALLWSGDRVAVANIGDSRGYLLRGGRLRQLTEDHVLSKLVASPMPPEIGGYLVRFLDARPGWSPDVRLHTARPGDRYLICSDGLSGVLPSGVIRDVLADAGDLDEAAGTLVALVHEAGAPDNVTLVAVDVPDGTWAERHGAPVVLGAAAAMAAAG
jgi:serine/threonine protein phosphatase PrpC